MMPGVTGRELARRLEALRPEMKLLYISGYPREAVFGEKLLEEEAEFLEKPISPEGLLTKIRQLLDSDVEEPDGSTDFVAACLSDVLNKRESYGLSPEQVAQLQLLAGEYERNRLLYDAEFMVAEMHVQTLVQNDASALSDIELALQKSERAQTLLRLEGVKTLRAAETLLKPDQRRRLLASYPHGRKRAPDRLQLDKKTVQ
jgi:response regulator RpfG family c-di-GMP phosphodiesterase